MNAITRPMLSWIINWHNNMVWPKLIALVLKLQKFELVHEST